MGMVSKLILELGLFCQLFSTVMLTVTIKRSLKLLVDIKQEEQYSGLL